MVGMGEEMRSGVYGHFDVANLLHVCPGSSLGSLR